MLTTIVAGANATSLARTLIDERLAACVNIFPAMISVYRWEGKVAREEEQQLIIKTAPDKLTLLETRLKELHPYELPEFIVLDGIASAAYGGWVGESVS